MKTFKPMKPEKIQPTDLKEEQYQGRLSRQSNGDRPTWDLEIQTELKTRRESQAVVDTKHLLWFSKLEDRQPLGWD